MELNQELTRLESQVPAKQEFTRQGTFELEQLAQALALPPVAKATEEELKEVLRLIMVKVGLRAQNWPVNEEKAVLLAHIRAEYGRHTVAEVRLAFEMAFAGKLDLDPKEVVCYENFSCLYFSLILNAYRKWAAEESKQIKTPPPEIAAPTEDLGDAAMIDWANEMRQRILSGAVNIRFMPPMLYDNLEKMGKIALSKEAKKSYVEKAVSFRQGELIADVEADNSIGNRTKINNFMTMKETRVFVGQEGENLRVLAKKIALYEFLKDAWQ